LTINHNFSKNVCYFRSQTQVTFYCESEYLLLET